MQFGLKELNFNINISDVFIICQSLSQVLFMYFFHKQYLGQELAYNKHITNCY